MQIERLKHFLAACHCPSLTEAANQCNVTQQTISIAIKELEDILGQTLFSRSKNGVSLTSEGQAVYPTIEQIVSLWDALLATAEPEQPAVCGNISFALSTNLAFFTSDIIASFSADFPEVNITCLLYTSRCV